MLADPAAADGACSCPPAPGSPRSAPATRRPERRPSDDPRLSAAVRPHRQDPRVSLGAARGRRPDSVPCRLDGPKRHSSQPLFAFLRLDVV